MIVRANKHIHPNCNSTSNTVEATTHYLVLITYLKLTKPKTKKKEKQVNVERNVQTVKEKYKMYETSKCRSGLLEIFSDNDVAECVEKSGTSPYDIRTGLRLVSQHRY